LPAEHLASRQSGGQAEHTAAKGMPSAGFTEIYGVLFEFLEMPLINN